jgi:hypothetical protein
MREHHLNGAAVRDRHRSQVLVTGEAALTRRQVERAPRLRDVYAADKADKPHRSAAGTRRPAQRAHAQLGGAPAAIASGSPPRPHPITPKHDLKSGLATARPESAEAAQ